MCLAWSLKENTIVHSFNLTDVEHNTGKGVKVLVVDSGVETSHPAFNGFNIDCYALKLQWERFHTIVPTDGEDNFGHGTAVADIIHQFAPDAQIDSIRVLNKRLSASSNEIVTAIKWGIKQRYDIINCSFGAAGNKFLEAYKGLIDEAFKANVKLVAACNNLDFRKPEYPGAFPSVISTNYGDFDGLALGRTKGEIVEFVARGEDVRMAWKGGIYKTATGSSYAAPHVAALVARILQSAPDLNTMQIKTLLYSMSHEVDE